MPFDPISLGVSGLGALLSGITGFLGADSKADALKNYHATPVALHSPADAASTFFSQGNYLPQLADFLSRVNTTDNSAWQHMLTGVDPSAVTRAGTMGSVADDYLHGRVPQDVQDQVTSSAAYKALMGGYGSGSGMGHALTARDLGRTSADFIDKGFQLSKDASSYDAFLNPSHEGVGSQLLSIGDFLKRDDAQDYYNNQLQNQENLTHLTGESINPFAAAASSGLGSLMGSLTSGGFKGFLAGGKPQSATTAVPSQTYPTYTGSAWNG